MTLSPGTRLGPYEIVAAIGAGGMGEVYKARDTRLDRTVAVKVLSAAHAASTEMRQRFEREARTISALADPHICALYDVGNAEDVEYLVMEYLEGETLADRLARGPLPLKECLRAAVEIASALERAHRAGIVHRDLKPGNVMLTRAGVKLLDFGLAKPALAVSGIAQTDAPTVRASELTAAGTILGTVSYMAPEQLEGREADARSDIFAFGSVLYEMVTGRRAFSGGSPASLIASILTSDPPPLGTLVPLAPPALERVVGRCLAKDPEGRWQTAADLASEIAWIASDTTAVTATTRSIPAARESRGWREPLAWALAALLALAAGAGWWHAAKGGAVSPAMVRLTLIVRERALGPIMLSPDGRALAYFADTAEGGRGLWVRRFDADAARLAVTSGEIGGAMGWSPDGRELAFCDGAQLRRIAAEGGAPRRLAAAQYGVGVAWGSNDNVLFGPAFGNPLSAVSAGGGESRPITVLAAAEKETLHALPHWLDDGEHFLFFSRAAPGRNCWVNAGSLEGGMRKKLFEADTLVGWDPAGYVLFVREGVLLAQQFDGRRLATVGEPAPIARAIDFSADLAYASASVSRDGVLVYRRASAPDSRLVWHSRDGRRLAELGDPGYFRRLSLSRDGSQVAVTSFNPAHGTEEVLVMDAERGVPAPLSPDRSNNNYPVWSPDGESVAFSSDREGMYGMYVSVAGAERRLLQGKGDLFASDWTADGSFLLYFENAGDIYAVPAAGGDPLPIATGPGRQLLPATHPNGKWVAYASEGKEERREVFVQRFPSGGRAQRVSTAGGSEPRWSADGKELYFAAPDRQLMVVGVRESAGKLAFDLPRPLFKLSDRPARFAPAPDGQRFLVIEALPVAEEPIEVVIGWHGLLPKR